MKCERCGKPYTDKQDQYTDGTYARSYSMYPDCDCEFPTYEELEEEVSMTAKVGLEVARRADIWAKALEDIVFHFYAEGATDPIKMKNIAEEALIKGERQ